MAQNDVFLLDSLVTKNEAQFGEGLEDSAYFELFCFDQLLKDYELSYDELASGHVDGGDDGGIDGFYTFLNDMLLTDAAKEGSVARNPTITVHVLTIKHGDTFRQIPLNSLLSSLPDLFELQRNVESMKELYNESLLTQRSIFRESYINLATSYPKLELIVTYACRGDTMEISPNVKSRATELSNRLSEMFSDVEVRVCFYGASELLQFARRRRSYSLRLGFIENYVSRGKSNYVLLSRLDDYYKFITDEEGYLRRYLFESNVRDYLGLGSVNREIMETLSAEPHAEDIDFWWLNNGVTILSSSATVAGKELSLENVQIVNGLQTTEAIYKHLSHRPEIDDARAVLLKVVVTDSDEVRDRIIRATNSQSPVEIASLRATDKIQRDIEHILGDHGWFYDRRKNYYKNQGRPVRKIVSVSYLGAAVQALVLRKPAQANEQRTRYMRDEQTYRKIFDDKWDLHTFLVCLEIVKHFDVRLRTSARLPGLAFRGMLYRLKFIAALVFVCASLRSVDYEADQLAKLHGLLLPTESEVKDVILRINKAWRAFIHETRPSENYRWYVEDVAKSAEFASWLLTKEEMRQPL